MPLLAGTLFQSTKLPLTTWFLAVHLLSQTRRGIPALELGRRLGGSGNTAWLLKHKLMQAMLERDQGRRLEGAVQLDDACLGGENPGGKRGRGSESGMPFVVAVQVTEDGRPVEMKLSVVEAFRKEEMAKWARECLAPGTAVHADGLRRFAGVEAAGCEHRPHGTGGGRAGCETPGPLWVNTILGNGKRSQDGTCHSFAPHCAARCLAKFQYRFNRRCDLAAMPRRMLKAAAAPADPDCGGRLVPARAIPTLAQATGIRRAGCAWNACPPTNPDCKAAPPQRRAGHADKAAPRLRGIPLRTSLHPPPVPLVEPSSGQPSLIAVPRDEFRRESGSSLWSISHEAGRCLGAIGCYGSASFILS